MNARRPSIRSRFLRRCSILAARHGAPGSIARTVEDATALAVPNLSATVAAVLVRLLRRRLALVAV